MPQASEGRALGWDAEAGCSAPVQGGSGGAAPPTGALPFPKQWEQWAVHLTGSLGSPQGLQQRRSSESLRVPVASGPVPWPSAQAAGAHRALPQPGGPARKQSPTEVDAPSCPARQPGDPQEAGDKQLASWRVCGSAACCHPQGQSGLGQPAVPPSSEIALRGGCCYRRDTENPSTPWLQGSIHRALSGALQAKEPLVGPFRLLSPLPSLLLAHPRVPRQIQAGVIPQLPLPSQSQDQPGLHPRHSDPSSRCPGSRPAWPNSVNRAAPGASGKCRPPRGRTAGLLPCLPHLRACRAQCCLE